ncbi:MAG: hypothetical protein ACRDDZ_11115 [Marinifilaceae bacterium]
MRTRKEISDAMKADFVTNVELAKIYGLVAGKTFDEQFSKVAIEALLIQVVSMSLWLLECIIGDYQDSITSIIESNYMCSIPWYHKMCLAYQDGYNVSLDGQYRFVYDTIDDSARIVKYAAVRQVDVDGVTKLRLLVSATNKGALTPEQLSRFGVYIKQVGAAGVHYDIVSKSPDKLSVTAQINYNPLLLNSTGQLLTSTGIKPVEHAIKTYLDGIIYGGVFNKTKLIDAIQSAVGVDDVILTGVTHQSAVSDVASEVVGQTVESASGSFIIDVFNLSYLPQ